MGLFGKKYSGTERLDGKTAIITGCNTGIGKITALDFYKRGCRVIMACRNRTRAEAAKEEIIKKSSGLEGCGELLISVLDLSSLKSIRKFAEQIMAEEPAIHLLINNAGIICCNCKTKDGLDMMFGTNHLGHFLLTLLLLPRIIASGSARIVTLSSIAHTWVKTLNWEDLTGSRLHEIPVNYGLSKLGNVLFTKELAKRLQGTQVTTYSVHPGFVKTDLSRNADHFLFPGASWCYKYLGGIIQKNEDEGAATTLHCALDPKAGFETGLYYADCKVKSTSSLATDDEVALKMWNVSWEMVKLQDWDPFTPQPLPTTFDTRL